MIRPIKFFISAVTSEFEAERAAIAAYLARFGRVDSQRSHATALNSGADIQHSIDTADIVVCLIGQKFGGRPLPVSAPRPPGLSAHASWTQWEYAYAHSVILGHAGDAPPKMLLTLVAPDGESTGRPEADPERLSQAQFRDQFRNADGHFRDFRTPFTFRCAPGEFLAQVTQWAEHETGGLRRLQRSIWAGLVEASCARTRAVWDRDFSSDDAPIASRQRFITSRGMSILEPGPGGVQKDWLKPHAFMTGMDTEAEQRIKANADWRSVRAEDRADKTPACDLVADCLAARLGPECGGPGSLGGVSIADPCRLFFISGSGVGKSTTLKYLQARLSGLGAPAAPRNGYAIFLNADDFAHFEPGGVETALVGLILRKVCNAVGAVPEAGGEPDPRIAEALRYGIARDLDERRICLLIDGLDHIPGNAASISRRGLYTFLLDAQRGAEGWRGCPIAVAGRPQAIGDLWSDTGSAERVSLAGWRFIEPHEFTAEEAETYLGERRYGVVQRNLGALLTVPRLLECILKIEPAKLAGLTTAADILHAAIDNVIAENLLNTRLSEELAAREDNHEIVFGLLSALGFVTLCQTFDVAKRRETAQFSIRVDQDQIGRMVQRFGLIPAVANQIAAFRRKLIEKDVSGKDLRDAVDAERVRLFNAHIDVVQRLAGFVNNGLIEYQGARTVGGELHINWSNRTIQQFLAAHWLARYADTHMIGAALGARDGKTIGTLAAEIRRGGRTDPESLRSPQLDWFRLRNYVCLPEADFTDELPCPAPLLIGTDWTRELNMFLAEMPVEARSDMAWAAAVSAWYDPRLFSGHAADGADLATVRTWPSEMIYRSWPTLAAIAGLPQPNWWNQPYEAVARQSGGPVLPRGGAPAESPLALLLDDDDSPRHAAPSTVAAQILAGFLGDFEQLAANGTPAQQESAAALIADEAWVNVPGADSYAMGVVQGGEQGVATGKVENYWRHAMVYPVARGEITPLEAAELGTWNEWFAGAIGDAMRRLDVEWLEELLTPIHAVASDKAPDAPYPESVEAAYDTIADFFRSQDETPAQAVHRIAPFAIARTPILNRHYDLFAPGHRQFTEMLLGQVRARLQGEARHGDAPVVFDSHSQAVRRLDDNPPLPDARHPAVYVSWFDAWAFCQWANWRTGDRRFGLRLPHEPEWEYACRWHRHEGEPAPSPQHWRWWWGDVYYADEENASDLRIVDDGRFPRAVAHNDGRPGCTRPPDEADPNGLGLHDMLGNVWEWMANPYSTALTDSSLCGKEPYDRFVPAKGVTVPIVALRVMRGGLWYYFNILTTCTNRFRYASHDIDYRIGFRPVRVERAEEDR